MTGSEPAVRRSQMGADLFAMVALLLIGILAGAVNALAGGGPILTLAGLTALGVDPRTASLTSTIALCPGQLAAGVHSRGRLAALSGTGMGTIPVLALCLLCGAGGGWLLLATDPELFRGMVGWLILFATIIYAFSSHIRSAMAGWQKGADHAAGLTPWLTAGVLTLLAIYGGYFGGGNSFLILALLAVTGLADRDGASVKNILVAAINAGAVLVFILATAVPWALAVPLAVGGAIGSVAGARLLDRVDTALIRPGIIFLGCLLAGWFLFAR